MPANSISKATKKHSLSRYIAVQWRKLDQVGALSWQTGCFSGIQDILIIYRWDR